MLLSSGNIILDGNHREYRLGEMIGKGGFGYVFKLTRLEDNQIFAAKTMFPAFSDETNSMSFINEIQSAQAIEGEGIVKYVYTHTGDTYPEFPPYIIMEYADGGTLREILDERKRKNELFENNQIIKIFKELASGMKTINNYIVHRDIKPENILICNNQMKITDFGLAKLAIESTRSVTFKGAGTPLYMSPEAWDYSKNTIQMDMYSMGLVFYEIATLTYAYDDMPKSYEEAKEMHMFRTIKKPSLVNGKLTPSIDSIICRMTEKRATKRFTNWDELINALEVQENRENSFLDKIVDNAVASKNADNIMRTEVENEEKRKEKKQEDFIKFVRNLFETEILSLINRYVDGVNQNYAGKDKMYIQYKPANRGKVDSFECLVESGNGKRVELNCKIVLENSFQRDAYVNDFWSERRKVVREFYTPSYKNKKIMLMCKVSNSLKIGYNLLLIESEELFGEWIIMKNFNNLSLLAPEKARREPFAFTLNELPDEINNIHCTHLYRTEFVEFTEEKIVSIINELITM